MPSLFLYLTFCFLSHETNSNVYSHQRKFSKKLHIRRVVNFGNLELLLETSNRFASNCACNNFYIYCQKPYRRNIIKPKIVRCLHTS